MKDNFILFDFDGVIVDSFIPAFEVNKMICPIITEDDYRKRFEGNINDWIDTDIKHDGRCRHDIDFFSEYIPKMKKQVTVVSGMGTVLEELAQSYTLIIISSTLTLPIKELLKKYKLASFFAEVMGNDIHKSKIEKIKMVFSKYKTSPKKCVFITDTLGDMYEVSHTKIGIIGVSWGFHKEETLIKGKPFKIVRNPKNLSLSISTYFSN